ncbi:MAG: zinc-binding dehydrogenase, partial [Bacteriovoracia bacterium]
HLCIKQIGVGVNRPGCFAQYLSIPAANVFHVPEEISDDLASILDPLGNAVHTALSFNMIGEDVLVTGAGPIGIMAAVVAKHVGARNVVLTDINEYRLELARSMGIELAVNINKKSLLEVERELKMTEGFDIGLEMSGAGVAFSGMLENMRPNGRIALLGLLPQSTQVEWGKFIFKGLVLKGIYGREMYETWYKMSSMLLSGLNIKPIITHHFSVKDYKKAFETMISGQSGKIILNWEGEF